MSNSYLDTRIVLTVSNSVVAVTITVGSLVVMIVGTTVTLGMTVVMIVTGMIATGTTVGLAGNALGRLPAVQKSMIVAPGLHLPGGMLMIEGLQGTMIDEADMMTEEALTLIMTVAGMITTGVGTTVDGMRRTIATMTGPRGTPTGTTVGRAEETIVPRYSLWTTKNLPQKASWTGSRISSNMFLLYGTVPCTSSSEVIPRIAPFASALSGLPEEDPLPFVRMEPGSLVVGRKML